jgi:pyridoxine kinase
MNILSIQSHVAYGHVGNAAAVFPLQRIGVEVWPIHTVQFSNHTGYGSWKGRVFDAGMIGELMAGIEQRGVLGQCDGVLSGYMGSADIGAAILDAVATVKRAKSVREILLRSRHWGRGSWNLCQRRHSGVHEDQGRFRR